MSNDKEVNKREAQGWRQQQGWLGGDRHILIADSCCCIAETNTTL